MNRLLVLMSQNSDLRRLSPHFLGLEFQVLYVLSGCDYVSFFQHVSKFNFFDVYVDNLYFISFKEDYLGTLSQTDIADWEDGLLAFYRLVAYVYFKKCAGSFRVSMGVNHIPSAEQVL